MVASRLGIESIVERRGTLEFTFRDLSGAEKLFEGREDRVRTLDDGTVHYVLEDEYRDIDAVLTLLASILQKSGPEASVRASTPSSKGRK